MVASLFSSETERFLEGGLIAHRYQGRTVSVSSCDQGSSLV
ncbi:MAG TPA: hypothetical protein VJK51_04675 [Candidatus Nanoarchaeia archaeon]|nr:hypothetical protein [Candidatus Nanoarchaeia archaeon]